jgi:hypothetical protein
MVYSSFQFIANLHPNLINEQRQSHQTQQHENGQIPVTKSTQFFKKLLFYLIAIPTCIIVIIQKYILLHHSSRHSPLALKKSKLLLMI